MKKQFNPLLGGLTLSASVLALSAVWVSDASAGIANTRHNLGSTNTSFNRFQAAAQTGNPDPLDNQICVFCHTPHGGQTTAAVPLWNKNIPNNTYQVYSSSSLQSGRATDGIAASPSIGSVSVACLSCHDGTQAMNNFINAPGSGGFNSAGSVMGGTWSAGNQTPVNTGTGILGAGIANLGTDLRNDHPIGISYCGGSPSAGTGPRGVTGQELAVCPDTDFNNSPSQNNLGTLTLAAGTSGATAVWYIDKGGAGRQKTDLPLYSRSFGSVVGPSIECGTCHDPHTDAQPMFLRTDNNSSGVCVSCHVK